MLQEKFKKKILILILKKFKFFWLKFFSSSAGLQPSHQFGQLSRGPTKLEMFFKKINKRN
jgi:hypothetical protein